ncbi:TetR/AcrR family transcriptional regulator [Nakamurella sp. GG22]
MNISRSYSSPLRQEAAIVTERRILAAAEQLFLEHGYPATTLAMIAATAAVSKQTVYNSCGSKAQLLKRLYDVRLVGDDAPVPLAQRPEVQRMMALTDPRALLDSYTALGTALFERLGPLLAVIVAGATAGDPDLVALLETTDAERLIGTTGIAGRLAELGALRDGMTTEQARDIIWMMNGLPSWEMLVRRRHWRMADYQRWLSRSLADMLLAPAHK